MRYVANFVLKPQYQNSKLAGKSDYKHFSVITSLNNKASFNNQIIAQINREPKYLLKTAELGLAMIRFSEILDQVLGQGLT